MNDPNGRGLVIDDMMAVIRHQECNRWLHRPVDLVWEAGVLLERSGFERVCLLTTHDVDRRGGEPAEWVQGSDVDEGTKQPVRVLVL